MLANRNYLGASFVLSGSDTRLGYCGEGAMHPSDPSFARDKEPNNKEPNNKEPNNKEPNNKVYLALESLEPILAGVVSGSSQADPVEMLETQLEAALNQLDGARLRLVRSRRRVGELQEVVAHLGEFLQAVGADGARQISNSKEPRVLRGLESHTA